MAIILYKSGNIGKINGIPCQFQICDPFSYLHLLEKGWYYTPEEVAEAEIKEEKKKEKEKRKEKKKEKALEEALEEAQTVTDKPEVIVEEEAVEKETVEEESEFDINNLYEDSEDAE